MFKLWNVVDSCMLVILITSFSARAIAYSNVTSIVKIYSKNYILNKISVTKSVLQSLNCNLEFVTRTIDMVVGRKIFRCEGNRKTKIEKIAPISRLHLISNGLVGALVMQPQGLPQGNATSRTPH